MVMADNSKKKYSNIRVEYRVDVFSGDGNKVLGDDIYNLLKKIKSLGSLKAAAEETGYSYRKIWGDLKEIESLLGFPLILKMRGGEHGGSTVLTEEGNKLVDAYSKLHESISRSVNDYVIEFKKTLKNK